MNINEIPTPETDAAWKDPQRTRDGTGFRSDVPSIDIALSVAEKSKDLERRLAIANRFIGDLADQKLSGEMDDWMKDAADYSGAYESIVTEARTLTPTAPKP